VVLLLDLESPWDLDLDMALDPDILDFVPDFDTQLQDQGTRGTLYPVETLRIEQLIISSRDPFEFSFGSSLALLRFSCQVEG